MVPRLFKRIARTRSIVIGTLLGLDGAAGLLSDLSIIDRAAAQTITSPSGELRLGMTEDEVTRLFHRPVEELRDEQGAVYSRGIHLHLKDRSYSAFLTKKGTVYSISSLDWRPRDGAGQTAMANLFQDRLRIYGGTGHAIVDNGRVIGGFWSDNRGYQVDITLGCDRTELAVRISDDRLQFADDGIRDDPRQRMPRGSCAF
ncbi:MAG: hypothetical protein AB1586_21175 [Pseudomonadota bacterium]